MVSCECNSKQGSLTTTISENEEIEIFQISNRYYEQEHEELPQELFEGNARWVEQMHENDSLFFEKLTKGQNPNYLFIGCSDSRVPAEQILGLGAGDLFVHRNIANVVNLTDHSLNAVIQFAVENLKVKHIIVCGHYDCGGIKAALAPHDHGPLHSWLCEVKEVVDGNKAELSVINSKEKRMEKIVELNVIQQCKNVMKLNRVQKSWKKYGIPHIQGIVFDIKTGQLIDLEIKNSKLYDEIKESHDSEL